MTNVKGFFLQNNAEPHLITDNPFVTKIYNIRNNADYM